MTSSGVALMRSPAAHSSLLERTMTLANWQTLRVYLRTIIQRERARGVVTPEVVAAFAMLHMQTDDGRPIVPAAHHRLWLRLICDMDIKRLLIIATPESAKTTWMMAYMACMVGFHPEWPGIIAAVSADVAEKRSLALRLMVESDEFRETFPTVRPAAGLAWRRHEWSAAEQGRPHAGRLHPTVSAYGTAGSVTGSRARWLVADDILDEENTRTKHQRDLVDNWLHRSLLSRVMADGGRAIIIGNAWHHDDAHARLRRNEGWVVCHIPLLSESSAVEAAISYPDGFTGRRLGRPVAAAELTAEAAA